MTPNQKADAATNDVSLIDKVGGEAAFQLGDPKAAGLAIVQRILDAETVDDVLKQMESMGSDDLIDQPIVILSAEWRKSSPGFEEGPGFYSVTQYALLADFDTTTGELKSKPKTATLGGQNVLAQLARITELNGFPFPCKLVKTERPTARGFYPLWLTNV